MSAGASTASEDNSIRCASHRSRRRRYGFDQGEHPEDVPPRIDQAQAGESRKSRDVAREMARVAAEMSGREAVKEPIDHGRGARAVLQQEDPAVRAAHTRHLPQQPQRVWCGAEGKSRNDRVKRLIGEAKALRVHRFDVQLSTEAPRPGQGAFQHQSAEIDAVDDAGRRVEWEVDPRTDAHLQHLAPGPALDAGDELPPEAPQEEQFRDPLASIVRGSEPLVDGADVLIRRIGGARAYPRAHGGADASRDGEACPRHGTWA